MPEKVKRSHRDRLAIVYIRQPPTGLAEAAPQS
jgi:hypothetical protein